MELDEFFYLNHSSIALAYSAGIFGLLTGTFIITLFLSFDYALLLFFLMLITGYDLFCSVKEYKVDLYRCKQSYVKGHH